MPLNSHIGLVWQLILLFPVCPDHLMLDDITQLHLHCSRTLRVDYIHLYVNRYYLGVDNIIYYNIYYLCVNKLNNSALIYCIH